MAKILIIEGRSGSGKTTSMMTLDPKVALYLSPNNKSFNWEGGDADWGKRRIQLRDLDEIPKYLRAASKRADVQVVVIDDHTHFQNNRLLSDGFYQEGLNNATKWARWENFGRSVYNSIFGVAQELREDLLVVVMAHVGENQTGIMEFKTFGKMTGNTVDPVSYADIVLHAILAPEKRKPEERYRFQTNADALHEAKSPIGMFDDMYIPNDLGAINKRIREYYQWDKKKTNDQTK